MLGRRHGYRIGEEPDRDGQYFHYLAMWMYALHRLGAVKPAYRERAVALVRAVHPRFVVPGVGVHWKMREDLSGPYPGFGLGALDPFHGYVVYRLLAPEALAAEIAEMRALVERSSRDLVITQDLGLGMMLWMTHFFPDEPWAVVQRARALRMLDHCGSSRPATSAASSISLGEIRLHQLRRVDRPAGGRDVARARAPVHEFFAGIVRATSTTATPSPT